MEIPKDTKEMVGKNYLFSGNFLDKIDRPEMEYLIKDVKWSDTFVKNSNGNKKHPCVIFLIDFEGIEKWTKPFPIRSINLDLRVVWEN